MIVKTIDDIRGTKGDVTTEGWHSYRLLHQEDGMGVTLTDAVLQPGLHQVWWYKNHLEAVYCLEGEGRSRIWPPARPIRSSQGRCTRSTNMTGID